MKSNRMNWVAGLFLASATIILPGCNKSHDPEASGDTQFSITDAPSDDANIKGVFVTIADIKVDGNSVSGFTKQTIDIKAFQEGQVKSLGTFKLKAKQYGNLQLILDTETDASGNTPGTYVLTTDDAKYKLNSGTVGVTTSSTWNVAANSTSSVVMDFDLRKSIKKVDDASVKYAFVSDTELQSAFHAANTDKTGTVSGTYTEQTSSNSDKIIVYAYKKGTYTASTEEQAQGESGIWFKNAASSAEVKGSGASKTYKMVFLEEGDYELHFASYHKEDATNRFLFNNMLQSQTSVNGSVADAVTVHAGVGVTITTIVNGL